MCVHHWKINQDSYGVCKKCDAEKQFPRPSELPTLDPAAWKIGGESPFQVSGDLYRAMEVAGLLYGDY